jgi:vancomycin aglycone glucosyltransferase
MRMATAADGSGSLLMATRSWMPSACAPPDFAALLARVGVPLAPVGQPVRPLVTGATPQSAADVPRPAAELVAAQLDAVAAAGEGCDAPVATGVTPAGVWR